jgi:hypothetical protein
MSNETAEAKPCSTERFRAITEMARFPVGVNLELVFVPLTAARILPADAVRLLQACPIFATLDEHALRLSGQPGVTPNQEAITRQLAALVTAGFLVGERELRSRCTRPASTPITPEPIAIVGVPTRDRPESLLRCLVSHVEGVRRSGRTIDFVICDDSAAADTRSANRQLLRELGIGGSCRMLYAGPEEKAKFADHLVRQAGLEAEVVRFALHGAPGFGVTTGGNRNCLLLQAAGRTFLQVDDDTANLIAPVPTPRPGLACASQFDPTEFWFLGDGEPVPYGPQDLLAAHEQLLGRSPADTIRATNSEASLDLDRLGAGFLRRLEGGGDARVRVTAAGLAGDPGMSSTTYFLMLEGESRARLLHSHESYERALTGCPVLRAASRVTLTDGGLCMAANLGLDNRNLLPPFPPVGRNQDGVFAVLVRSCVAGAYFGYLPQAVFHRSAQPRRFRTTDVYESMARLHTGQVLELLARSAPTPATNADHGAALRSLGRYWAEWGSARLADFEDWVRVQLWAQVSRQACHLESLLQRYHGQPDYWANDVRQCLTALHAALPTATYHLPRDQEAASVGEAAAQLQRLVRDLGRLLLAWPDLVAASRDCRAEGHELAVPV